MIRSRICLFT